MKARKKFTAFVLLGTLVLAGCASGPWKILHDDDWILDALGGHSLPEDSPEITLKLAADGRVTGSAGCNIYMGSYTYTASDNTIRIGPISRTEKVCLPDEVMEQEERFMELLTTATMYEFDDDRLELQTPDGSAVLIFIED